MTDEELIARLRWKAGAYAKEAADRIEALIAERDQWRRAAETRAEGWKISDDARIEAEIKLAKAVEALLWCSGSPDFNEGGMARKGWLKLCAPIIRAELTGVKDD
jgi:hypothetical protein